MGAVQVATAVVHSSPPSPAFFVALVLYGVSSLAFITAFLEAPKALLRASFALLALGFVAHGVDIGWRGTVGVHPGMSVREALGFLSWLLVGGYLYWGIRHKLALLGAIVGPTALAILAVARLSPKGEAVPGLTSLGRIHISLATLGVAIFMLATLVAVIYLLQERGLKRKQFDSLLYKQSAALETLDRLSHRLVLLGFPIFTASIMLGVVWVAQRGVDALRIEYPIAMIAWGAFAVLAFARTARGWRGRRAAVWTIAGFAAAVIVLAIYLVRRALV